MAEPRDDRVSAAWRELPREEPSPALDAAIQAAARRAVGAGPSGFRRWQKPLSIAAVLMLAVAVTLQVEREKPLVEETAPVSAGSAEYPVPQQAAPAAEATPARPAPAAPAERRQERAVATPAPKESELKRMAPEPASAPASQRAPAGASQLVPAPASAPAPAAMPAAPPPAAMSAPAPRAPAVQDLAAPSAAAPVHSPGAAPPAAKRAKSELAREATTQEKATAETMQTPERRLERIAGLRARGLHDEADRELAAFRRELPDYRMSEEWLRKVERR